MAYVIISATRKLDGKWALVDERNRFVQEGYGYDKASEAMDAARELWPANSVWHGKNVPGGWRIETD